MTDTESVDLEALITHEGTAWVDEQSDTGEMTWADRVAQQEQSLLSQTAGVSGAQPDDFVILHNMTSKCSPRGRAHGGPPLRGGHQWTMPDNRQDYGPNFDTPAVQHQAEVAPVFLAFNRVSTEGHRISLIQIATSVCQALSNPLVVDVIQLMCTGWCIYVCGLSDRQALVNKGITVAGKYIAL